MSKTLTQYGSPARSHLSSRAASFLVDRPAEFRAAARRGGSGWPIGPSYPGLRLRNGRKSGDARGVRLRVGVRSFVARTRVRPAVRAAARRSRVDDAHSVRRRDLRSRHRFRRPLQPERDRTKPPRSREMFRVLKPGGTHHRQRRGAQDPARQSCSVRIRSATVDAPPAARRAGAAQGSRSTRLTYSNARSFR